MVTTSLGLTLALMAATPPPSAQEKPAQVELAPAPAPGAAAPSRLEASRVAELLVREVVVFSDRARVTRRGEVSLGTGERRLELPALPATADPDSVRLEARGAAVKRLEIRRARRGELPRVQAEQLLRNLEAAVDEARALEEQRRVLEEELELIASLRPAASPQPSPELPPVTLEPAGWGLAMGFFSTRATSLAASMFAIEAQQRAQAKKLEKLRAEARQLAGGGAGEPGWIVEAVLEGKGAPARLELIYMASGARWLPAYDVRHAPGSSAVEVHFAGLVSQQTGEDWEDAKLVLSTAIPATTALLPKLAAWKIGDRDQFIPQPQAKPRPVPPAPPMPASRPSEDGADDGALRSALMAAAEQDGGIAAALQGAGGVGVASAGALGYAAPMAPPPPASRAQAYRKAEAAPEELREEYEADAESYIGDEAAPAMEIASAPAPQSVTIESSRRADKAGARMGVSFGSPGGWSAPAYSSELPAALAGGYDYTFASARPESVRSGGEARRVALHAAKLPAKMLVTITPALAKQAYLVADLTNSADRPLLQGPANLYVGADLQGQARLQTVAVGEKFSLPLGVDEAIGVERNVNVLSSEKGFVSKDDVTRYEVVIELLNPRSTAIDARVIDQIPLAGDQKVKIKLDQTEPWAIHDAAEGTLEWHVPLAPKQKRVLRFTYTLTRPKNAQLRQW